MAALVAFTGHQVTAKKSVKQLQPIQTTAARFLQNARKLDHITPLFLWVRGSTLKSHRRFAKLWSKLPEHLRSAQTVRMENSTLTNVTLTFTTTKQFTAFWFFTVRMMCCVLWFYSCLPFLKNEYLVLFLPCMSEEQTKPWAQGKGLRKVSQNKSGDGYNRRWRCQWAWWPP